MAEIFKSQEAFNNHPDRWNHDLTHKRYGSYKAGVIYPVLCEPLFPTDSFRLDMASLLQFMPTVRPLQSNVRVIFHVFAQRNKNIVEGWDNYIEKLEDIELPTILPSVREFTHNSIHNYLGVPTNVVVKDSIRMDLAMDLPLSTRSFLSYSNTILEREYKGKGFLYPDIRTDDIVVPLSDSRQRLETDSIYYIGSSFAAPKAVTSDNGFQGLTLGTPAIEDLQSNPVRIIPCFTFYRRKKSDGTLLYLTTVNLLPYCSTGLVTASNPFSVLLPNDVYNSIGSKVHDDEDLVLYYGFSMVTDLDVALITPDAFYTAWRTVQSAITLNGFFNGSFDLADFPQYCPYATQENPNAPIKLSALPYRVYESAYNCFYRNTHGNQPFTIDGRVQYNKYNTTKAPGVDRTTYQLFRRNWELDAFTSCMPSPQQGEPPLIGVSATGRLTIENDDGTRSTVQLQDLPNGQKGLAYSNVNLATDEHRQIFMNLASSGISINDLREGNALQKFLETNMRKGFRYVDFLLGHFGKAPKHAELDMPEFLGGFTIPLSAESVMNTNGVATSEDDSPVLGDLGGRNRAFGSSKHSISYYAEDYCFLLVTMTIVPDTAYSQILPKHFLYSDPLDWAFPEFTQLGYQAIDYREICPIQAYMDSLSDSSKQITDVFGYQRPNHDLIWKPDTLHGLFTTSLNNYAINRAFHHRPELGNEFLTINSDDVVAPFADILGDDDIAYGQIGFRMTAKRFIPRIVIPTLGR